LAPAAAAAVAVVLSSQSSEPLLLGVCVDVCADNEADNVEEWDPGDLWEELLGKRQRDGGNDPADLHDGPETSLDSSADLVEGTGACNERHGDEVDAVLDGGDLYWLALGASFHNWNRTDNQIAEHDLQDLGLQACAPLEDLLEEADKDVAKGRADDRAIQGHLRDVSILVRRGLLWSCFRYA
jgi:hypothetical protein